MIDPDLRRFRDDCLRLCAHWSAAMGDLEAGTLELVDDETHRRGGTRYDRTSLVRHEENVSIVLGSSVDPRVWCRLFTHSLRVEDLLLIVDIAPLVARALSRLREDRVRERGTDEQEVYRRLSSRRPRLLEALREYEGHSDDLPF